VVESRIDAIVKGNDATTTPASQHHMTAVSANGLEAEALRCADDLPGRKGAGVKACAGMLNRVTDGCPLITEGNSSK
jgi:hypothetical protein